MAGAKGASRKRDFTPAARVEGLKELQRELRKIDRDLPKEMAAGLMKAADVVAATARLKVPVGETGNAQRSIKPRKNQRSVTIAVGGTKALYYPWLDFGGKVGRNRSVSRPVLKKGRYLYPAYDEKRAEVLAIVDDVLETMARRAGFEQRGRSDL